MRKKTSLLFIVIISIASFLVIKEYNELRQPGIIVLLYHKISNKTISGDKYTLHVSKFGEQLDYLLEQGYSTILPQDILKSAVAYNSSKEIILSFDDGSEDHYSVVYPLLKERKMKGIFFIVTRYIGRPGLITASHLIEMRQNNMEIGSHSYSHPFLDELDFPEIYFELYRSKSDLEKVIREDVVSFAAPGGWFNDHVVTISRKLGYKALFGCEIGTNDISKKRYVYKRIEVLGDVSIQEFEKTLNPPKMLKHKIIKSLKQK